MLTIPEPTVIVGTLNNDHELNMALVAAAPSKQAILSLYHSMLRSSQSFSSYNFREYFVKRTQATFRELQNETNPDRVRDLYAQAVKESTVLRRSSIVNQLYGGWKLAVEVENAPDILDRGDT